MKLQDLFEAREYWSHYDAQPQSKAQAKRLKAELAHAFKISESRIKISQFLANGNAFRQVWTIKLTKAEAANADFIRTMASKFLLADFKKNFDSAVEHDSWVGGDGSSIGLTFTLVWNPLK